MHGVPWDFAMRADDTLREGLAIIVGTLKGAKFDWSRMEFKGPDA